MRAARRSKAGLGRALIASAACSVALSARAECPVAADEFTPDPGFTSSFLLEQCSFATRGRNPYFILLPGYQLVLESEEERAIITVLDDERKVDGVWTRVVEELAFEKDGDEEILIERSLNYFAICRQTNSVVYFGEDVEFFDEDGDPTGSMGAWLAGRNGARPGIVMPGTILMGGRYYEEIAPEDSALDKGEITMIQDGCEAGDQELEGQCVVIRGTNDCNSDEDEKRYAEGVGVIADGDAEIVSFGFVDGDGPDGRRPIRASRRLARRAP